MFRKIGLRKYIQWKLYGGHCPSCSEITTRGCDITGCLCQTCLCSRQALKINEKKIKTFFQIPEVITDS